jgi:hypothetical protein
MASEDETTATGPIQPREHVEEGGFPGSVWANQASNHTFFETEVEVVQSREAIETLNDLTSF